MGERAPEADGDGWSLNDADACMWELKRLSCVNESSGRWGDVETMPKLMV